MIYIKKKQGSDLMISSVYEDEFYCRCPKCGKEVHLDKEMLKEVVNNGDLGTTAFYCKDCNNPKQQLKTSKLAESQLANHEVLSNLFNQVKDSKLQKELFTALDTYNQLVFNDLSEDEAKNL